MRGLAGSLSGGPAVYRGRLFLKGPVLSQSPDAISVEETGHLKEKKLQADRLRDIRVSDLPSASMVRKAVRVVKNSRRICLENCSQFRIIVLHRFVTLILARSQRGPAQISVALLRGNAEIVVPQN